MKSKCPQMSTKLVIALLKKHIEYFGRVFPSSTLSELIRILPRIWDKKSTKEVFSQPEMNLRACVGVLATLYMDAPTEPEGIRQVEDYLMKLL